MSRASLAWILAVIATMAANFAAEAASRAKADVACRPAATALQYECIIRLTDARAGTPLTKVDVTLGADMPSMPMMHNVAPVKATPAEEPGTYRALLELEMHGDWALQFTLSGALRDRLIKTLRFEDGRVEEASRPKAPPRHKH
jgi:YtkA-like